MATLTTFINGYEVQLSTDPGSDPGTDCGVTKGRYHGSLALLMYTHTLEDNDGDAITVPASIVDRIEAWATANGY